MEYSVKPKQKLTLSSTFNRLHATLWQQKEKNYLFEKQNIQLNTKIKAIKQNFNPKACKLKDEYAEEKQQLKQLYAQIKNQEEWLKQTTAMIEEKNFDREYKRKARIEKKLCKTNKKCKELTKKLLKIQQRVELESNDIDKSSKFLGYYEENEQKKLIKPSDVMAELQKENQELSSLCRFKDHEQVNENRKVKCLNSQIINLLALKNWLRRYGAQSQKMQNTQKIANNSIYCRPNSSGMSEPRLGPFQKMQNSSLNNRLGSSLFRQGPKLKITTY